MFIHIYHQIINGQVLPRTLTLHGQQVSKFPSRPPHAYFNAALVHPIKNPNEMHLFHYQSMRNLRPILPPIHNPATNASKIEKLLHRNALFEIRRSCTHNPVFQLQVSGIVLSECIPMPRQRNIPFPLPTFLVSFTGRAPNTATLRALSGVLDVLPLPIDPTQFARDPVATHLAAIRSVFEKAITSKLKAIVLITQDTILHEAFASRIQELMNNSRCTGHLFTERYGGVITLGSREWTSKSWTAVAADYQRARLAETEAMCYNIGRETFGTFAAIFSRNVYEEVIEWIDNNNNNNDRGQQPFHRVLQHLVDIGRIVRAAFPTLAIQDVSLPPVFEGADLEALYDVRNATARIKAHKWGVANFSWRF